MSEQTLRPYQQSAIDQVVAKWDSGTRRVLLVSPTGSGKTTMANSLVKRELTVGGSVLFVVHRRELLKQAAKRFRQSFGHQEVGIVAPGADSQPYARIQVGTVQTLIARNIRPDVSLVIFDEARHFTGNSWEDLSKHYSGARLLGLDATPERQDGSALGDLFDDLVVGAKYSELLADGFLVKCAVYQPPASMDGDLACDPVIAYQKYAPNTRAFVFCTSVAFAYELAKRYVEAGVPAICLEAKTNKLERDQSLQKFESGELMVLVNVGILTEGVDVPIARTVILAKNYRHQGSFIQAAGRVLRPHPTKPHAILIDLTGATLTHGFPTDDREYSLTGEGIKRAGLAPLRVCPQCGITYTAGPGSCPECGFAAPAVAMERPTIHDYELRAVFAGAETPVDAKDKEYQRLRTLQKERGWAFWFIAREYKKLFGVEPVFSDATEEEKRKEFDRLRTEQQAKNFKPGYVGVRYKSTFGVWPPREWANQPAVA